METLSRIAKYLYLQSNVLERLKLSVESNFAIALVLHCYAL